MSAQLLESALLDQEPSSESFLDEVLLGLQQSPKSLPCKYFYDERGSRLFDKICDLDEYYLTRTELAIMDAFAPQMAEQIGLDSVWFVDHLLYRNPDSALKQQGAWECWSILTGLAAVTEKVELGSLVTPTSFRNPAVFAKQIDVIEEISGGRVILGIGAGWNEPEYLAFGLPFDRRVSRFEEAFTIIRTLLQDGAIDFVGRRKLWYSITLGLLVVAVVAMLARGFNLGIDFEGGTKMSMPAGDLVAEEVEDTFVDATGVTPELTQIVGAGDAKQADAE